VELLVVIAIIGIIAAVGIPAYQGYISEVKAKDAQNTLQSIAMEQKSYFNKQFCFYITGEGDNAASINTGLFGSELEADGPIPIANNQYSFEITGTASTSCTGSNAATFTATATNKIDDSKVFSITNTLKKTGF
jgi:type IV pilus assembly protein PilE